jgi:hypothetical protein
MAVDQVFSDRDSEDEVDDDIADFEDRRVRYNNIFAQKHKLLPTPETESVFF